jgi:hypothetical protein
MREFSKVYRNVWTSQKFGRLDHYARLVYLYLLTSPHSNSSGCYDLKEGYATADLDSLSEAYRKAMASLEEVGLIEREDGTNTVLLTNWCEFNEPTNAKHAIGILAHLDAVSSERLKHKRGQEFVAIIDAKKYCQDKACGAALDRLCIAYRKPMDSLSSPRPRPRPDLDQTETRPDLDRARASAEGRSAPDDGAGNVSPLLKTSFINRGVA